MNTTRPNPDDPKPVTLSQRFEAAMVYAAQVHRNQLRKNTAIPYVSHLLAVIYGASSKQRVRKAASELKLAISEMQSARSTTVQDPATGEHA